MRVSNNDIVLFIRDMRIPKSVRDKVDEVLKKHPEFLPNNKVKNIMMVGFFFLDKKFLIHDLINNMKDLNTLSYCMGRFRLYPVNYTLNEEYKRTRHHMHHKRNKLKYVPK